MCECASCRHSRGEIGGDEYETILEKKIKIYERLAKDEKNKSRKYDYKLLLGEVTELLICHLQSKEKNES